MLRRFDAPATKSFMVLPDNRDLALLSLRRSVITFYVSRQKKVNEIFFQYILFFASPKKSNKRKETLPNSLPLSEKA